MLFSRIEVSEYARKIGKSERTLWRWIKEGCNPRDPKSLRDWQVRNEIRQTPIERARRRRRDNEQKVQRTQPVPNQDTDTCPGNGDLPPAGKLGASAALQRLEKQEEESHRRFLAAQATGDQVAIQAAADLWLKCSELLRKLDLAIETSRRQEEAQIPLRVAQDTVTYCAEWLRIGIAQFLSSETNSLMAFKDNGEFRAYFIERLHGVLSLTIKAADKTNSALPTWAKQQIKLAWNLENQ
jgi:hypothetical protein